MVDMGAMCWSSDTEMRGKIFVTMGIDPLLHFTKCQGYIWKAVAIFSPFIKIIIPCLYFTHENLCLNKKNCLQGFKIIIQTLHMLGHAYIHIFTYTYLCVSKSFYIYT